MLDCPFQIVNNSQQVDNKPLVRIENKLFALLLMAAAHVFQLGRAAQELIAGSFERSLDFRDLFVDRVFVASL